MCYCRISPETGCSFNQNFSAAYSNHKWNFQKRCWDHGARGHPIVCPILGAVYVGKRPGLFWPNSALNSSEYLGQGSSVMRWIAELTLPTPVGAASDPKANWALSYNVVQIDQTEGIPMNALRLFLVLIFLSVAIYTGIVIANHGWNLLPIFFGDMAAMTWPGQFNFDFMGFLLLSGLWVSWRHQFSPSGIVLGLLAVFGGVLFLSLYLLIGSYYAEGSAKNLLLGNTRANR